MARKGSATERTPSHWKTAAPRFLRLSSPSVTGAAADGDGVSARSRIGAISTGSSAARATDR